jgi:hypothetical protein
MEAQLSLFLRRNKKAADEERIKWEEGEDLGHRSLRPPLKGKAPPWDLLIFPSSFNYFYPVSGCWILIVVDDPVVFSRLRCPSQFLPFSSSSSSHHLLLSMLSAIFATSQPSSEPPENVGQRHPQSSLGG